MWIVYILKCRKDFLYTGVTNNLLKRIVKHNDGKGAKFTKNLRPCEYIWHEHHLNRSEAQKRESEIKKWHREKKIVLINEDSTQCLECSKL